MGDVTRPPRRTRGTAKRTPVTPKGSPVAPPLSLVPPLVSLPVTPGASSSSPLSDDDTDALAAAIARHPAGGSGWQDMDLAAVAHLSLLDIGRVLDAAGYELRIQTRRSPSPR